MHYDTEAEARCVVEPRLIDWEIHSALDDNNHRQLRFRFHSSQIVDRNPSSAHSLSMNFVAELNSTFSISISSPTYPLPPTRTFSASADVIKMWNRYEAYRNEKEPLLAMAYYCLTVFRELAPAEGGGNKRERSGRAFRVDPDVLSKLGDLTANYGDEDTARKSPSMRSLTPEETNWVATTVRELINRVGEVAASPFSRLSQITMLTLPSIPPR